MSTIKTTTLSTQGGSTVAVDTVVNGTAKAWVNFNGTGTVAIRRAFNVSSISDVGVGQYRINFTSAMIDTNYAVMSNGANAEFIFSSPGGVSTSTDYASVVIGNGTGSTNVDRSYVSVSIFS
jgi:hypothetical protein